MAIRSIDLLVRTYPEKTGQEILEIQEQDKWEEKELFEQSHKETIRMIQDYNKNGAFFKSTFGLNQYRFDSFSNLKLEKDGTVTCNVEKIVGFNQGSSRIEFSFECKRDYFVDFYSFNPQIENRVSRKEFENAKEYLHSTFEKFWSKRPNVG